MGEGARRRELERRLAEVEERLGAACRDAGRARGEVTLVAVTKTWPASDAEVLRDLGVRDLAENRDQEAAAKAAAVPGVRWHFVGRVQTNKARSIASYADVVHAVDRLEVVRALSDGATRAGRAVEALVQVSLDGDVARGGAAEEDVAMLADAVEGAPGLWLGGVMAVAPLGLDPTIAFDRLARVAAALRTSHPGATAISAGMSGDLEQAIAAGSTRVRVGSAILGPRPPYLG